MQGNSVVKRAKNGCHSNSFIMILLSGRCTPGIWFYILFIVAFCALSQRNIKAVRCCCSWALAKVVARLLWELYLNWEAFQNEHCFKWNSLQEVKCPKVASKALLSAGEIIAIPRGTGNLRGLTKNCRSSLWEPWAAASKTEPFFFF